jgi:alcohol dehydrogenase class IV
VTPHIFSMVLGARYGVTHGRAIAAVTPACLRRSKPAAVAKLAQIARILGATETGSDDALADWAIDAIEKWIVTIGMKRTLTEYGVPEKDFPGIAHEMRSAFSLRLDADPVPPTESDLLEVLQACK